MPTSVDDVVTILLSRRKVEDASAAAAASEARRRLPELVDVARRYGVRSLYLFGSLADGRFMSGSDIDLAVEGLDRLLLFRLSAELNQIVDQQVDLLRLEEAPPSLVERVRSTGERLL